MRKLPLSPLLLLLFQNLAAQPAPAHNLVFQKLPTRWDAGLPLGNGMLGCLVWQKGGKLRLSLDRADLWDTRPLKGLDRPEFSYRWVAEQVAKGTYGIVQEYFDRPYEQEAGPTKLPGAALEMTIGDGESGNAELDISTGLATVSFSGQLVFKTFIHANRREGWFRLEGDSATFENLSNLSPALIMPKYAEGDLARLGYPAAEIIRRGNGITCEQLCREGFRYEVAVAWRRAKDGALEGVWSISSHRGGEKTGTNAEKTAKKALKRGFARSFNESKKWWAAFWARSSVSLPDTLIERQYYRDMYKFGCAARADAPMINLQSVWTADNGRLPPWKSDFHHDLNTQLSYWPAYASGHLDLAEGYLNHLERNNAAHRVYTRRFFGTSGLDVPGVETLAGEPLGGWIQYAFSPTVSAWLAQHFYLQWRYSQDRKFLKNRAWPFLRDAAVHLEELTRPTAGKGAARSLPLSSSPEINDNSINAWFPDTWTNYDLALARFVFEKTAELADVLKKPAEARKWRKVLSEMPGYATEPGGELKIAPGLEYRESHRHFSHLMAIHPLGLLDWSREPDRDMIRRSLQRLDSVGSAGWTGYSFAWLACLRARAHDGAGARDALRIFAEAFVSPNSFHLNGDQSGKGYSKNTGDPFTLEGNSAFAAGVQEMLLQSQNGGIRVFPAVPGDWKNVSFNNLRAEGAMLASAVRRDGRLQELHLKAEKDTGFFYLYIPDGDARHFALKNAEPGGYAEQLGAWRVRIKAGGAIIYTLSK